MGKDCGYVSGTFGDRESFRLKVWGAIVEVCERERNVRGINPGEGRRDRKKRPSGVSGAK